MARKDEAIFETTAKRVGQFIAGEIDTASSAGIEQNFLPRLTELRKARQNRKWIALSAVLVLCLVVAGVVTRRFGYGRPDTNLSYRVDGRAPLAGGYVLAQSSQSSLAFSDGSRVMLSARARGRVVEVSSAGARFALEEGLLAVDIVHRPNGRWLFEAGPFLVTVHGTSFTVEWHPTDAVFELRLRQGAVSVSSPVAPALVGLRAGQTLRVSLRDQTSTVGTLDAESMTPAPSKSLGPATPAPTDSVDPVQLQAPAPPASAEAPSWSNREWPTAITDGRAVAVLAEADRLGMARVLRQADSDDLWALANAARYAKRYELAEQALTEQRRRFAGSPRAREAAFLLGRLHDGDPGGPSVALTWYDRYLSEAPQGTYVPDALGRKMTLMGRWDRRAEAAALAAEYIRRFPQGTYANAATLLLRDGTAER
jgi:TolA-binding protein